MTAVNRAHWQMLAEERIVAAQALLAAQQWSSAYYPAGYAVEFGLKSCILVHVEKTGAIFREKKFSEYCWSHDVEELLELAGLETQLDADMTANPLLWTNWRTVKAWNESSRYDIHTQTKAEDLHNAIIDPMNGVMPWIKFRW
jgi:HEPN domain-containing protein